MDWKFMAVFLRRVIWVGGVIVAVQLVSGTKDAAPLDAIATHTAAIAYALVAIAVKPTEGG